MPPSWTNTQHHPPTPSSCLSNKLVGDRPPFAIQTLHPALPPVPEQPDSPSSGVPPPPATSDSAHTLLIPSITIQLRCLARADRHANARGGHPILENRIIPLPLLCSRLHSAEFHGKPEGVMDSSHDPPHLALCIPFICPPITHNVRSAPTLAQASAIISRS